MRHSYNKLHKRFIEHEPLTKVTKEFDESIYDKKTRKMIQFEAISPKETPIKAKISTSSFPIDKAQDLLVSVKAFIDNLRNIQEYERKQPWLDDVFSYLREVSWEHAQEEISEILYKWGRFLLDNGKYRQGLLRFWDLYERFPNTRWYDPVYEELVSLEQPEDMVFISGGFALLMDGDREIEIELKPYFIDKYPVTNAQYLEFVKDTHYLPPRHWKNNMYPLGKGNHPVTWVSAVDAVAYANWKNKYLPNRAEWEKAAQGPEKYQWPWGNDYQSQYCNCRESANQATTPVNQYKQGISSYHCYDMIGNVWEWVDTLYKSNNSLQILKGGSWFSFGEITTNHYCNFDYIDAKSGLYGFRCAKRFQGPEKIR